MKQPKSNKFLDKIEDIKIDEQKRDTIKSMSRMSIIGTFAFLFILYLDTNNFEPWDNGQKNDLQPSNVGQTLNFLQNSRKRTKNTQGRYFKDERISLPQIHKNFASSK